MRMLERISIHQAGRWMAGFVLGGSLLTIYLYLIGIEELRRVFLSFPTRLLWSLLAIGFIPMILWGGGLFVVLSKLGYHVRVRTAVLLFTAASFLNAVTPFGETGGDPAAAVLFSRSIGTDFETGLAAIGSLNALNRVASVLLGILGVSYVGTRLAFGTPLQRLALLTVGFTIGLVVVLIGGWQYRYALIDRLTAILTPGVQFLVRWIPGREPPSADAVARRGTRFIGAIERLADDPLRLLIVFALSLAGQVSVAATLWMALAAFGSRVPFGVVLFIIPLAKFSGIVPTPGGFGSAEALLITLITATTGTAGAIAGAGAVIYRASAFWVPALIGALAIVWFVGRPGSSATATGPEEPALAYDDRSDRQRLLRPVTRRGLRVVVSLTLVVMILGVIVIHRHHLLVEPANAIVHVARDGAIVVLVGAITWSGLRRLRSVDNTE
ncbi:MAG: lysylphosphatidylglycerol synthase transmembrane domain-containing protein [Halobacteriales archaeon]